MIINRQIVMLTICLSGGLLLASAPDSAAAPGAEIQCPVAFSEQQCQRPEPGVITLLADENPVADVSQDPGAPERGQVIHGAADSRAAWPDSRARGSMPSGEFDEPFSVSIFESVNTSRPFAAGNYAADGQFRIEVLDGSCPGVFTVNASPVAESGPAGSTPPTTTVTTYIGFDARIFLFDQAGAGDYLVTVTQTGDNCVLDPDDNPQTLTVSIDEGPLDTPFVVTEIENVSPSERFDSELYEADGQFRMAVADGSCPGTYTVNAAPVSKSGPAGSTPPTTSVTTYIGFPAGEVFFFDQAGAGDYIVTTTQTSSNCAFEPDVNPVTMTVSIINLLPEIAVEPGSVEVQVLVEGDPLDRALRIENVGQRDLNWEIDSVGPECGADWLVVAPLAGGIAPDDFQDLVLTLTPAGLAVGQYQALLCIANDDPGSELLNIPVSLDVRTPDIFMDRFEQ